MTQDILAAIEAAITETQVVGPSDYDEAGNFIGHQGRRCGEHRTTGDRARCFDCNEWCSASIPCERCCPEYDEDRTERIAQAHRRILELHRPVLVYSEPYCDLCRDEHGRQSSPCETVRALADAYGIEVDGS